MAIKTVIRGKTTFYYRRVPDWQIKRREEELEKAGFLKDEIEDMHEGREHGLRDMSLKALRQTGILKGRRNEVHHAMRDFNYTRAEAIAWARRTSTGRGYILDEDMN